MLPLSRVSPTPSGPMPEGSTRYTRYDRNDGVRIAQPQEVCTPGLDFAELTSRTPPICRAQTILVSEMLAFPVPGWFSPIG